MALTALVVALAVSPVSALSGGDLDEAHALIGEARYDDAIALLTTALESNRGDAELLVALAQAQRQSGMAVAAIETLDRIDKPMYGAALARGQAFRDRAAEALARGNAEDAEFYTLDAKTHFERAVEMAPEGSFTAHEDLGYLNLYDLNDYKAAFALANEGLEAQPDNPDMRLLRGCAGVYVYYNTLQTGDETATHEAWKMSVEDLLMASEKLPRERVEPLGQLCYMYDAKGLPNKAVDAAIEHFDRQVNPTLDTLYYYADKYSRDQQLEAAAKALEKIVSVSGRELTQRIRAAADSDVVAEKMHYAVTPLVNRGDAGTARSILAAIVAAEPQVPVIWNNYGVVCENAQRHEEAVEAYETSLEIDPTQARAHNDLAALLHHTLDRELDRAKELYQRCIDLAEAQLADETVELSSSDRMALNDARQVARDNLAGLKPKSSLLDSMLEGVRKLDLPKVDGEEKGGNSGTP